MNKELVAEDGFQEEGNQMNLEASQRDIQQQAEDKLTELKREKARAKSNFTKCRRCLLVVIQSEEASLERIKHSCEILDEALDSAMDIMVRLSDSYMANKDRVNVEKVDQEIEKIEAEYSEAQNHAQSILGQMSSNRVVKRIWEESSNGSQAFNTEKSVNNVATLQSVPLQSDGRTENYKHATKTGNRVTRSRYYVLLSEVSPDSDSLTWTRYVETIKMCDFPCFQVIRERTKIKRLLSQSVWKRPSTSYYSCVNV